MGRNPHPYGWDAIERIEIESLEPLVATRAGDGWWVLGIEGHLDHMAQNPVKQELERA